MQFKSNGNTRCSPVRQTRAGGTKHKQIALSDRVVTDRTDNQDRWTVSRSDLPTTACLKQHLEGLFQK